MNLAAPKESPLVSLIVVNYNCKQWLARFFPSIKAQTLFERSETILVDNTSQDGSDVLCEQELATWPNGTGIMLRTGANYGFGGGCNRGAAVAKGKYLLFLNPDLWLEPNCLEELVRSAEELKVKIGCPRVLDYESDTIQTEGADGFDLCGGAVTASRWKGQERFAVGTFFFVEREFFEKLGGFDDHFFIFGEEVDLSWRAWIAGEKVTMLPKARLHHQGASTTSSATGVRTNETKRFYASRNQLLTLLKDAQHVLLLLAVTQVLLLTAEAIVGSLFARRLSFARWALFKPLGECWRLRREIRAERRRIKTFRQRGDWWMLRRFFKFRFGRWNDVKRLLKCGVVIDKARQTAKN